MSSDTEQECPSPSIPPPPASSSTLTECFCSSTTESDDLLFCGEDVGSLADTDIHNEGDVVDPDYVGLPDEEEVVLAVLMEGEAAHLSTCFHSSREPIPSWSQSVDWIIKVSKYYNFSALATYLAVSYMDRFLSSHEFPEPSGWPMQLLSVACLSLSAKLEEPAVPSLLDLQIEGASFVFEPRTVCRMELLILKSLNWRMSMVTPFAFLDFFLISKIGKTNRHLQLHSRVKTIIINSIRDVKLFGHSPSAIAAAAIVYAAAKDGSKISLDTVTSWWSTSSEVVHREEIMNCYNLICGQRKRIILPSSNSSSSSSNPKTAKRRKLDYTCDRTPE